MTVGALEEERLASRAVNPLLKQNRLGLVVEDIEPGSPQYEMGFTRRFGFQSSSWSSSRKRASKLETLSERQIIGE